MTPRKPRVGKRTRRESDLKRRSSQRQRKIPILIVCEGKETEPNYFRGLGREDTVRNRFALTIKKGKGGSAVEVVAQAIDAITTAADRGEPFDQTWCVFDAEKTTDGNDVIKAQRTARKHEIQLAISNPAFEVWFLAHFVRTKRSFADANAVIRELNKHWQEAFKTDYEKNDETVYPRLAIRTRDAISNARTVREQDWGPSANIADCNSATDVYHLVELLLGPE